MWSDWRRQGLTSGLSLVGAIVSILFGIFLLGSYVAQFAVDMFIAYLITIWLIVGGVTRIAIAIDARRYQDLAWPGTEQTGWGSLLALGILIVILGVLCFFNPLAVMAGVGMMLGISIACVGVGLIIRGVRM